MIMPVEEHDPLIALFTAHAKKIGVPMPCEEEENYDMDNPDEMDYNEDD